MTSLQTVIWRTRNANRQRIEYPRVSSHQVASVHEVTWSLYRGLQDDDVLLRTVRSALWRLSATVTHTLLPFTTTSLGIAALTTRITGDPMLPAAFAGDRLALAVNTLLQVTRNPKLELVAALASDHHDAGRSVSILRTLSRSPSVEGWPDDADEAVAGAVPHATLVRTVREIESRRADVLIVPSGGRQLSHDMLMDLHHGGLAHIVQFVSYGSERCKTASVPAWRGGSRLGGARTQPHASPPTYNPTVTEPDPEPWRWQPMPGNQRRTDDLLIAARAVLLEKGQVILLPEHGKVIEVSALIDSAGHDGSQPARKPVTDLRRGDVLVLRTRGSGDHLDSVADDLMRRERRPGLRNRLKPWRTALASALRSEQPAQFLVKLADAGFTLQAGYGYLANYVAEIVIGPSSRERLGGLLSALVRHGYLKADNLTAYIDDQWKTIEQIRSYHRKAAIAIRSELLDVLSRQLRGQEHDLTQNPMLAGVAAGELALMRVAEVDADTKHVGAGQLYKVESATKD